VKVSHYWAVLALWVWYQESHPVCKILLQQLHRLVWRNLGNILKFGDHGKN